MKTSILSFLLLCFTVAGIAQPSFTVTSMNQNFDNDCVQDSFANHWTQYREWGQQTWNCSYDQGLHGSPCMTIDDYTTHHNVDTQILYTPRMDLSSYQHIYFNFYDRYARNGDSLGVYVTDENGTSDPLCDSCTWTKITIPFSALDTNWRMHQIDLTSFKDRPIYIAFKYTSTDSTGSIWYIDSAFTSTEVFTPIINTSHIPLAVRGISSSELVTLECTMAQAGEYAIAIYDVAGRKVGSAQHTFTTGTQRVQLRGTGLRGGLYMVKVGNATSQGVAKVAVP